MNRFRHLLLFDSIAGLTAGVIMLSLSGFLSALYALPRALLVGIGVANLLYGTYSGSLARRTHRPMALLIVLVVANATWAALCVLVAVRFWDTASPFGLAQLLGESVFVGVLARLEWRHRALLTRAT
ncbi:MAG: hypothetical protein V4617_03320 [Gemmatimonadota bacterium]